MVVPLRLYFRRYVGRSALGDLAQCGCYAAVLPASWRGLMRVDPGCRASCREQTTPRCEDCGLLCRPRSQQQLRLDTGSVSQHVSTQPSIAPRQAGVLRNGLVRPSVRLSVRPILYC